MAFREDLHAFLIAQTALTDLVGTRLNPSFAKTRKPDTYVTYQRVAQQTTHHQASGNSTSNIKWERYSFDCWAKTSPAADAIAQVLEDILDGFAGLMNTTRDVRRVFMQTSLNNHVPPIDGSQVVDFRSTIDFLFWYLKIIP